MWFSSSPEDGRHRWSRPRTSPLSTLVNRVLGGGWRWGGKRALAIGSIAGSAVGIVPISAAPFDAAPFALPLPPAEGVGLLWEDPREIHEVRVNWTGPAPPAGQVRLQYWGSWWPDRHLPKDREPGGGEVGWMELGNWWKNGWRDADTETSIDEETLVFRFRPVNQKESPKLTEYPAAFRYTLKLRLVSENPIPGVRQFVARTDSRLEPGTIRIVWDQPAARARFGVFNGQLTSVERPNRRSHVLGLQAVVNSDPNTFDRTLVTVTNGSRVFTFRFDDLADGALFLPDFGAAILPTGDARDFAGVRADVRARGQKTLRERVAEHPEQSWSAAWSGMPRKKSDIYFPLGLDGGRQRFRVWPDGHVDFRHNDPYLRGRPGADTPRLDLQPGPVSIQFGLPPRPVFRTLAEESLPVLISRWETNGLLIEQTAFVTELAGHRSEPTAPPGDTTTVWMARFTFTNRAAAVQRAVLDYRVQAGDRLPSLRSRDDGRLTLGENVYGQASEPSRTAGPLAWSRMLRPGETWSLVVKVPYVVLTQPEEAQALVALDFEREREKVTAWWRRRLDAGARLTTPEPMLDEFHRSVAMHLLVNCEREPGADRRFARVGSYSYGAYGNESCMMVLDLERRGFHREAEECLEAWLHYQGTAPLPGSFADHDGVLYGAGGYEAGGYNQHHGWILWMLAEHYRFTRDTAWLKRAAPGIVQGADWILRETARTQDRHPLERGLLPAGSLEDIGDWWTWLSTSCYTWRGLDNAAWALEQVDHPDARRLRRAATDYHRALLANFRTARDRSPVVRLRDGTAVPKVPSHVHRRGRSFGWICETLEGSLHLLITRAIDVQSPEARWIVDDYEDNLFLSNQYGYLLEDFDGQWFSRGGMSMQACLLLQVEPWLYRDDVKAALRSLFNAQAASYFPDVRMNTEHALPFLDDWRGDHFKSSDEANCAGWLRQLFVREENEDVLVIGQAIPREWLTAGRQCGLRNTATWFGPSSIRYTGADNAIEADLEGPRRNPPKRLRVRFRDPRQRPIAAVNVNGQPWRRFDGEWVDLPGDIGKATLRAVFSP